MDPQENPLWYARQLVDTLRREVAMKEAELSMLLAHKAKLFEAFSTPTFPPGYVPSGSLHIEQYNGRQDRPGLRHSRSAMGKEKEKRKKNDSLSTPSSTKGKEKTELKNTYRNHPDRAETTETYTRDADFRHIYFQSEDLGASSDSSEGKTEPSPLRKGIRSQPDFPVVNSRNQIDFPVVNSRNQIWKPPATSLNGGNSSDSEVSDSSEFSADKAKTEPSRSTKGIKKQPGFLMMNSINLVRQHPATSLNGDDSSDTEDSDSRKSSAEKAKKEPSQSMKGIEKQPEFPMVNWTNQIRKHSAASLNGDDSSDSSDSSAEKVRPDVVQPTNIRKNAIPVSRPAKPASQALSLSPDALPEDLFDWEVLALTGPWLPDQPGSNLLSESSWAQLKKQKNLPPCRFENIDAYRSTFEGLIFEECKAHLKSSWEMLQTPELGTTQDSSAIQGVPGDRSRDQTSLWQFRLMYPYPGDPFNTLEARLVTKPVQEPPIRLDPAELVLLTHNDMKLLAIVILTTKKDVLLRTRIRLQVSVGQVTVLRLSNVVTLKRQYISLLNVSEMSHPLKQQLLDPQKESNLGISPPSDSCPEKNVKLTSRHKIVLTWKKKKKFNNKQLVVVEALLQLRHGFLLVQGMVSAMHIEEPRSRILVCASSNAAVDEIVSRLMDRMLDKAGDFYAPEKGTLIRTGVKASIQPACLPVSVDKILRGNVNAKSRRELLFKASIVCCTISGSGNQVFDELNQKFDVVIIDEAAQALESEVLIALQRVNGRCVMVGDPCQLPAVVLQRPGVAYGRSLFERMQDAGQPVFLMTTQYRMHPHISQFPSAQFYKGHVRDSSRSKSMQSIYLKKAQKTGIDICGYNFKLGAYSFLDVPSGLEQREVIGHSLSNMDEAAVVTSVVQGVVKSLRKGIAPNIGVITPYLAQRWIIMKNLEQHGLDENACEVNTVDGFQGREKDVIILSCVRAQSDHGLGFVSDVRRMNVALTRARHSLIIVGHAQTLQRRSPVWNKLIEDVSVRDLYQMLRPKEKTAKIKASEKIALDGSANVAAETQQHSNQRNFEPDGPATTAGTGPRPTPPGSKKRKAEQDGTEQEWRVK